MNEARSRVRKVIRKLKRRFPDAKCSLDFDSPFQLLVATILSAQCTDARVNLVTADLFRKYRTVKAFANADPEEFQEDIRSTGFFRNKTKSILGMANALLERHGGEVPRTLDELSKLPGVGRKTANVVLGTWFGTPAIPVDTHVKRLVSRMELTAETDPVKIEYALQALLPPEDWTFASHGLIWHGRRVCKARKPLCEACPLTRDCPFPT